MKITRTFKIYALVPCACLAFAGCASPPELVSKSAVVPPGVDFSGLWRLRVDPGSKPIPRASGDTQIRIPPENSARNTRRRLPKRGSGTAVYVFLETGESLKISQTKDGLFISFDRAIVEEYTFGENRVISVGPIEAQRVSGWQERVFVVETLDEQGTILTESWHLDSDEDLLVREISVSSRTVEKFSARQRFDRT